MRSHKDIHFAATPLIFSLIPSTLSAVFSTATTPTSIENIRVYLVIAVSIYVYIIYK